MTPIQAIIRSLCDDPETAKVIRTNKACVKIEAGEALDAPEWDDALALVGDLTNKVDAIHNPDRAEDRGEMVTYKAMTGIITLKAKAQPKPEPAKAVAPAWDKADESKWVTPPESHP